MSFGIIVIQENRFILLASKLVSSRIVRKRKHREVFMKK